MPLVNNDDLAKIIRGSDNEVLVKQAEHVGKQLARQLTTSQIRGIFGSVRRIELDWEPPERKPAPDRLTHAQREFAMLKPRLAYQAQRERGFGVKELKDVLTPAIDMVQNDYKHFRNFVDFFEAILAYHKAYGGQ